jgi:hypothetical protein
LVYAVITWGGPYTANVSNVGPAGLAVAVVVSAAFGPALEEHAAVTTSAAATSAEATTRRLRSTCIILTARPGHVVTSTVTIAGHTARAGARPL